MNDLMVIEHNKQRVLTTSQLAEAFGTDGKRISENFSRNANRYTEGKHYFILQGDELISFKAGFPQFADTLKYVSVLTLWTEKGAWMQAKSLNTDQAWEAYERLVDDYYNAKQASLVIDISRLTPEMQMFHQMFQATARTQLKLDETTKKLEKVADTVEVIQETFLHRDKDWRKQVNSLIAGAAFRSKSEYSDMRTESYRLLEERAHCDLDTRLRNLKKRMEDAGATKTQVKDTNRMDVIECEPRLKEIYSTIVKELSIGSLSVVR